MKTITIELRTENDTPEADQVVRRAAVIAAKSWLTTAALVAGRRKPQIVVRSTDFFAGQEVIELAKEGDDPFEVNEPEPKADDAGEQD